MTEETREKATPNLAYKKDAPAFFSPHSKREDLSLQLEVTTRSNEVVKVHITLSQNWSSQSPDFRSRLRKAVATHLQCGTSRSHFAQGTLTEDSQHNTILDLLRPPKHPNYSISISHSLHMGGYATCASPFVIGFDVEEAQRVTQSIATRISRPEELGLAEPSFLWTAKEAAFKAASALFPVQVMSEIWFHNWTQDRYESVARFEAHLGTDPQTCLGNGLVLPLLDHVLAVFVISPSTLVESCRRAFIDEE